MKLENPKYAILLTGSWGCGKTFFIKKIKKEWEETENLQCNNTITLKPIYVSLNGVSKISSINEKIRAEISPFLYSKGMKVAKKIFTGLLKTTVKIDLNIDKEEIDGNIFADIDPIGVFTFSNTEVKGKRILIFDDIERCKLEIDEIFGYINNFVEHSACKVILLADEEKIKEKNKENPDFEMGYKKIKEKLIGQTFKVKSEVDTAISLFIEESKEVNETLNLDIYQDLIIELFTSSGTWNLRVLRQALFDFNRFIELLGDEFNESENYSDFIKNILAYFIIVYLEYKAGNDKIQDFQNFILPNDKELSLEITEKKYRFALNKFECIHSNKVFPLEKIVKYIEEGFIAKEEFKKELEINSFFRQDEEQEWEKLWSWQILEYNIFERLKESVWRQFRQGEFVETTILLHVAGIFIALIDKKLLNQNKSYVVKRTKEILNQIFKNDPNYGQEHTTYGVMNSSWGKQYQSLGSPEFREIKTVLDKKIKESQEQVLDNYLKELFEKMSEDSINSLELKLEESIPNRTCLYRQTAIFKNINGKKLGKKINSFSPLSIYHFKNFIHARYYPEEFYSNGRLEKYYVDDVRCLIELKDELISKKKKREKIKNLALKSLIEELEVIISKIESLKIDK